MQFTDLKCCPFCGCEMYYEKQTVKGQIEYNSMFNGKEAPNDNLYEGLNYYYSGKCYCRECGKYIGNNAKNIVGTLAEKQFLTVSKSKYEPK